MKNYILFASVLVINFLTFTSCHKDNEVQNDFVDLTLDLATQQDFLESNETEIKEQVEAGLQQPSTREFPTRTWSASKGTYPNTLTIDYGTAGVVGLNGHVRKGKLIISLSAPLNTKGSIRMVQHENFSIDEVRISGTVTVTNKGLNGSNEPYFERIVTDRKLTFPSGKTITWNATQTIVQIQGGDTPLFSVDDVFTIDGQSLGINRAGKNFVVTTSEPLVYRIACYWIVKGIVNITLDAKLLVINYGDGTCNNLVELTLPDGTRIESVIRRWW